jgi:MFS transporter, CP family, cyanate transporter
LKKLDVHTTKKLNFSKSSCLLIIGILFIGFTLRSPLTSVGPIIGPIRDDLGISNLLAGFLTTIPLLAFAIISPFAPRLARRFGLEITLFGSLILVTAGILLRSLGSVFFLLTGTFLIGVAIAFANVLLPSLLKLSFPMHIGLMTGIYTMSMNISATTASGVAVPIANGTRFGWQGALGIWAVLGLVALLVWLPQLKHKRLLHAGMSSSPSVKTEKTNSLLRSPIAWSVTFFMGLQSLLF